MSDGRIATEQDERTVMRQDRKIVTGFVTKNVVIADGIFEMSIESEISSCNPGQFVNVYLDEGSLLLPRPISICDFSDSILTIVYRVCGKGTKLLSQYQQGRQVRISCPLGNGYMLDSVFPGMKAALVAGGVGVPPMIELAKRLKEKGAHVNIFFGYASAPFLLEKLEEHEDFIAVATEDGSAGFHGNVLDLLSRSQMTFDEYYACGPRGMLKALAAHVEDSGYREGREIPLQVSLEERMGCGYGACVGCACKIKGDGGVVHKSVCKHGPVFYGKDVAWDEKSGS